MQRCGQIRRSALYRARRGEVSRRLPAWRLLRRADGFPASNDGALQLDVRLTLETDDGAPIFMTYRGIRHGQEAILARLSKGRWSIPASTIFALRRFLKPAPQNTRGLTISLALVTVSDWRKAHATQFLKFFKRLTWTLNIPRK